MQVKCDTCGKFINKKPSQISKTKHNFCDHSCAARFTNHQRRTKSVCPSCGGRKDYSAIVCRQCSKSKKFEQVQLTPISRFFNKGNSRIKYSQIRKWANKAADYYELPKCCSVCSFSIYTEVAHIIPISEFSDSSLMRDVNSKDNLVRLCPNHHIMLDKGIITPAEVRTRKPSD